jgi:hypothetical protein
MNKFFTISIAAILFSCGQSNQTPVIADQADLYNTFDTANHLRPTFDKIHFDTSHGWEFCWAVLEPINIAKSQEEDKELSKRFSPGQKALYFFWYLDDEVTNGGFIQFYWNQYRQYLPAIRTGLELIGDHEMLQLLDKADKEFITHKKKFEFQFKQDDWGPLYNDLKNFDKFDEAYYKINNHTMELIEKYARLHPEEFVNL